MNNNERLAANDLESSDETDKSRKKKENEDAKVAAERLAKSFARTEGGLLGVLNEQKSERKDFAKIPVHPPVPLEKIINASKENDDKDEETKEDESKSKASAEVVSEAASAGEAGGGASGSSSEEVFETMSSAGHNEFMDIPHVDHDRPSIPLTPAENNAFAEMVSELETPDDTERKDTPPIPSWEMPTVSHPLGESEAAPPEPTATSSATPFWRPSPAAPTFESSTTSSYSPPPGAEAAPSGSYSSAEISNGVAAVVETLKAAAGLVEAFNSPNKLITRALTEAVTQAALDGFLRQRKQAQGSTETVVRQQKEEIAELQDRQRQANERLAALFQEQNQQTEQGNELVDQNGNRIILQPGQHVERAAGGYSVVVDAHGRPVSEAITYGEAYQHEQQREQLSDDVFAAVGGSGSAGGAQDSSTVGGLGSPFPPLPSQSQNNQYSFPSPPSGVDLNHRLPEPQHDDSKKPVVSPWLWTAVAIIIIVYFIAQMA